MSDNNVGTSEISNFLNEGIKLKPKELIISDLKWKYLLRSVLKNKNVLMVGPSRCGKTMAAHAVAKALKKDDKFFVFNIGSTQDARATLIGNTTFKKELGTIFHPSAFVKAIKTPGAIILLDELTRGSHDAWNILMPVLDPTQRYLRLDEQEDSAVIKMEEVCIMATANVGNEFTATRVLDKAISTRFPVKIEMEPLNKDELMNLLDILYPNIIDVKKKLMGSLCEISDHTRIQVQQEDAEISSMIPTGQVVEMAEMAMDGFSLVEIAEMAIYPDYPDEGGAESERLYMKQLVQRYITTGNVASPINDPLKNKKDKNNIKKIDF
jgi:predicted AAA+ superfamily ATPase